MARAKLKKSIHDEFKEVLAGTGCFKGMFSLQVRGGQAIPSIPKVHDIHITEAA